MNFSPQILDEIRARLDIVELVGQVVNLKRAGQHWKGLCPFHAEKTPSFTVNPKRGIFHCFGCGAGGDAFGFIMRHDRLPRVLLLKSDNIDIVFNRWEGMALYRT